jgi:hypothetical protein
MRWIISCHLHRTLCRMLRVSPLCHLHRTLCRMLRVSPLCHRHHMLNRMLRVRLPRRATRAVRYGRIRFRLNVSSF